MFRYSLIKQEQNVLWLRKFTLACWSKVVLPIKNNLNRPEKMRRPARKRKQYWVVSQVLDIPSVLNTLHRYRKHQSIVLLLVLPVADIKSLNMTVIELQLIELLVSKYILKSLNYMWDEIITLRKTPHNLETVGMFSSRKKTRQICLIDVLSGQFTIQSL